MTNQLLLIFLAISIFEFINYFKLVNILKSSFIIYKKLFKTFKFKKVSDFRKEILILNYAKLLFIFSLKIFFLLGCIIMIVLIIIMISNSFKNLIISILGLIEFAIIIYIYSIIKKKINE